jgi:hypothetical protein
VYLSGKLDENGSESWRQLAKFIMIAGYSYSIAISRSNKTEFLKGPTASAKASTLSKLSFSFNFCFFWVNLYFFCGGDVETF